MSAVGDDRGNEARATEDIASADADTSLGKRGRMYLAEAAVGILIGLLVLWVLIVSVSDVEFVYQGF